MSNPIKSVKINGEWIELNDLCCYYCGDIFGSTAEANWLIDFHGDWCCDSAGCKHEAIQNYSGEMIVYDSLETSEKSTKYPEDI